MKKLITILLLATLTSSAQTFTTPKGELLTWTGKAAVGSFAPEGSLEIKKGELIMSDGMISKLVIEIDMKSLDQENKQLRSHLKDKDFFHVKKFPKAHFISTQVIKTEDGDLCFTGTMTIKGISQIEEIVSSVKVSEGIATLSFRHKMDRTNYGVNYNSPSVFEKIKENAIADEFVLNGTVTFRLND